MSAVAACPNVVVKVGGLVMPVCGFDWHERPMPTTSRELAQSTAPYYLYCIEQFGPDRCMFESNFPVDKIACSYTVLWNAFKRLAHDSHLANNQLCSMILRLGFIGWVEIQGVFDNWRLNFRNGQISSLF
ncbi:MAG: hypothetical protein CM1200mP27_11870 [Chloroflexota bacterium]|nr:MAG: hypothetical protein CM1200mP27_11870 [Chloroflexota bacterium]